MRSNPFYALSASAMLFGCWQLSQALALEAGKLRALLVLMLVLQLYELLLAGLGTHLVSSQRAPRDGRVVLALGSLFLMNATGLSAECVNAELGVGTLVALALAALGALKLGWVRRGAPDLLPGPALVVLGAHAALVLALPVVAAHLAAARAMSPLALYGLWWLTAALPLAHAALRDATRERSLSAPRAHAIWTWMPCGLVLWHLWSVGYVHTIGFWEPFLAPFALGLAVAARPEQQRRKLALPLLAVLATAVSDLDLAIPLLGFGVTVSPLRLTLVVSGMAWAYLAWRDRDPWLAALPIGGAALYLFGPLAGRLIRGAARMLVDAIPRDRYGWGALTVIAAFVLLAAGARRSLLGEPRWPRRPKGAGPRRGGGHVPQLQA